MFSHNSLDAVNYQRAGGKTFGRIYQLVEVAGKMKNPIPLIF